MPHSHRVRVPALLDENTGNLWAYRSLVERVAEVTVRLPCLAQHLYGIQQVSWYPPLPYPCPRTWSINFPSPQVCHRFGPSIP